MNWVEVKPNRPSSNFFSPEKPLDSFVIRERKTCKFQFKELRLESICEETHMNEIDYCLRHIAFLELASKNSKKNRPIKNVLKKNQVLEEKIWLYLTSHDKFVQNPTTLSNHFHIKWGQANYLLNKFKNNTLSITKRRSRIFTDPMLEYIENYFTHPSNLMKPVYKLKSDIVKEFHLKFKNISMSSLYRWLHRLKISYKNVIAIYEKTNTQKIIEKRYEIVRELVHLLSENYTFIYLDETSFHLHDNYSRKAWFKRGKKIVYRIKPKSKNYTLIAAITAREIMGFLLLKGGAKGADYFNFLLKLIKNHLKLNLNKTIFFADNGTAHKKKELLNEFSKYMIFKFNAPYSPQTNPIEMFFHILKTKIREKRPKTENQLLRRLSEFIKSFDANILLTYMLHTLKNYVKCLNKIDL